jgi:hypothetical protein
MNINLILIEDKSSHNSEKISTKICNLKYKYKKILSTLNAQTGNVISNPQKQIPHSRENSLNKKDSAPYHVFLKAMNNYSHLSYTQFQFLNNLI